MAFCHYVRGRVLCDQDRLKDAEAAVQEAIRLVHGEIADHYAGLALAYDAQGKTKDADDAFKKCIALDNRYAHSELLLRALIWEKPDADKLQVIADRNR